MKATQLYRKHNGENSVNVITKLTVKFLQLNVPNFIEPSVWPTNSPDINPVDYAVWGALQQDVYRVPIVGLEDLTDRVRTCWASLNQQLINKAIHQWRPRLKTVVKIHGGHIEQLFTWLSKCCVKFSLFYLDIYTQARISTCFTIVI